MNALGKFYTGIGSRETPPEVLKLMRDIGAYLGSRGHTLRSGGADGADSAFEQGCDAVKGKKEIYLPWRDFNGNKSEFYRTMPEAEVIAARLHPAWDRCSRGARSLHARNIHQVLGQDLKSPSKRVIFWAPTSSDGTPKGGTRTAVVLALEWDIQVSNLSDGETFEIWRELVKTK